MVYIPDFPKRWSAYRTEAHLISPYFPEGRRITQDFVAALIPENAADPLPASAEASITGAGFGFWLSSPKGLPDERIKQWEELTRLPIEVWAADKATFERTVLLKAGHVLGWRDLVQRHAKPGVIRIRTRDATSALVTRFGQEGEEPPDPHEVQFVWPDCIATVELPLGVPEPEPVHRRAWMTAVYPDKINILDPPILSRAAGASTRLDKTAWKSRGKIAYVELPRGATQHVRLPSSISEGVRFAVVVLVMNLVTQPDELVTLFDAIERRLQVSARELGEDAYQKNVTSALDEAAFLMTKHDVRHTLYSQKCLVVSRSEAVGGGHGSAR